MLPWNGLFNCFYHEFFIKKSIFWLNNSKIKLKIEKIYTFLNLWITKQKAEKKLKNILLYLLIIVGNKFYGGSKVLLPLNNNIWFLKVYIFHEINSYKFLTPFNYLWNMENLGYFHNIFDWFTCKLIYFTCKYNLNVNFLYWFLTYIYESNIYYHKINNIFFGNIRQHLL